MNRSSGLHYISAQALVPEQILPYVAAVGGSKALLFADCVGHVYEGNVVLVAYPPESEDYFCNDTQRSVNPSAQNAVQAAVDAAVSAVCQAKHYTNITVLAPVRPSAAPPACTSTHDMFWSIPLPPPPQQQKLRNMLRRAHRDITIQTGTEWTAAHAALAHLYCQSRPLPAGTRHIFQHLGDYVRNSPEATVFSAFSHADNSLVACAVGEFSSMSTALYMFAFRQPTAPPGTSDALLGALCMVGHSQGHSRLNLGLGINTGISFFKHKWQAQPFMPYVESAWQLGNTKKGWWGRVFG